MRHEREYSSETARDSFEAVGRSPARRSREEGTEGSFVLQAGATSYSGFSPGSRALGPSRLCLKRSELRCATSPPPWPSPAGAGDWSHRSHCVGSIVLCAIDRTLCAEFDGNAVRPFIMDHRTSAGSRQWAAEGFGHIELGDSRRTRRLVAIAAAACERPSGRIAAVFTSDAEREAAYDFVESEHVSAEEIIEGIGAATVRRCVEEPFVFVPVDGSSVTVTDRTGEDDFGRVGSDNNGARGLKVVDALAVDPQGTPVGLLTLTWWARHAKSPPKNSHARQARPVEQKETRYWVQTVEAACAALDERELRGWYQIDREGDGRDVLLALHKTSHWWTVRGNADRSIELQGGDKDRLRSHLAHQTLSGTYDLTVPGRPGRQARVANMVVRVTKVHLRLRDKKTKRIALLPVTAVWALEHGTTPPGEKPIDWLLYTNHPVETFDDAMLVLFGYAQRWRVEEFHRTWKRGDCDIESTQLDSFAAVKLWATIVAAVAVRLERVKRLARVKPDAPATIDFSPTEIRALKMLKFGDDTPRDEPTIAQAVLWLAELGGYANKYSGKSPGATVLGRGLKHLRPAARLLELQHV